MRCDLHVHTRHSGMCTVPVLNRVCRESYNEPAAVYETLRQRGMNLITVTDHDSIDAVEALRRYPDFFLSEEVTCTTPSGTELHMGVYGITERQHVVLQQRRNDLRALIAYLHEQRLLFSINHVFSGLTGRRADADFALFAEEFPAYETRNGMMGATANRAAEALAHRLRKICLGGSDGHALSALGKTYTEVPGARTAGEFLAGLRTGQGTVHGEHGSFLKLTSTVFVIVREMLREQPWTWALAPLAVGVPLVTLANVLRDERFAARWEGALRSSSERSAMTTPALELVP